MVRRTGLGPKASEQKAGFHFSVQVADLPALLVFSIAYGTSVKASTSTFEFLGNVTLFTVLVLSIPNE